MLKLWLIAVSLAFQPALKGAPPQTPRRALPAALPGTGTWAGLEERRRLDWVLAPLALAACARLAAAAVSGTDRSEERPAGRRTLGALRFLAPDRGLRDVEALRHLVMNDLDLLEERLRSRRTTTIETLLLGGSRLNDSAFEALRTMRHISNLDMNRLQMALLRGDPLLAFLRDAWLHSRGRVPVPIDIRAELAEQAEAASWLQRQIGQQNGLDPQVVDSIVRRVKHDPALVERLALEARDRQGRDAYASGLLAGLQEARRQQAQSWLWVSGRRRDNQDGSE